MMETVPEIPSGGALFDHPVINNITPRPALQWRGNLNECPSRTAKIIFIQFNSLHNGIMWFIPVGGLSILKGLALVWLKLGQRRPSRNPCVHETCLWSLENAVAIVLHM
jgi:hypothetical protein